MHIRYALQFHNFRDCTVTLAYFSSTILAREVIGDFLSAVEGIVAKSVSWKAKTAALDLLQVSVFFNMPTILCNPEWVSRVMSMFVLLPRTRFNCGLWTLLEKRKSNL